MKKSKSVVSRFDMSNKLYEREDAGAFDYKLFSQFGLNIRGPAWKENEHADINVVGSARVFGRLVHEPLTTTLTEQHGLVARNIGYNGCTPTSVFNNKKLMHYLKNSPGVPMIQLCALDGGASDWYVPARNRRVRLTLDGVQDKNKRRLRAIIRRHRGNLKLFAVANDMNPDDVTKMMRDNVEGLPDKLPPRVLDRAGRLVAVISEMRGADECLAQMKKTQDWGYDQYARLVTELDRPVILLSFYAAERPMMDESNFLDIASTFPQFVDKAFRDRLAGLFSGHVEVIGHHGVGYIKPGENEVFRDQYPTQEMHLDCANKIAKWYQDGGVQFSGENQANGTRPSV